MANLTETIEKLGFGIFSLKIIFVLSFWWLTNGIEMTSLPFFTPYIKCEFNLTSSEASFTSSAVYFGYGVGSLYWGWLADIHGRKVILICAVCCCLYFSFLSAATTSYHWLIFMRAFVGFAIGAINISPLFIIEYLSKEYRAHIILVMEFFWVIGNIYIELISYLTLNQYGYQLFLFLATIPLILQLVLCFWLPESLHYLQNKGDTNSIMQILSHISKKNKTELPKEIILENRVNTQGNFGIIFNKYLKMTFCITIIWIAGQCLYYSNILLNTEVFYVSYCGYSTLTKEAQVCHKLTKSEYISTLEVVLGELVGVSVFLLLIGKVGRKTCIMLGLVVNLIGFFVISFCVPKTLRTAVMAIMRGVIAPASNITYTYTLELYPTTVRSIAIGFASALSKLFLILVPFLTQLLIYHSFPLVCTILMGLSLTAIMCLCQLKDTKGKDLKRK